MTSKVSISIVMYQNRPDQVRRAIESCLQSKIPRELLRVLLVDNSPTDQLHVLASQDDRIEYRHVGRNIGYGSGHNVALRHFYGWSDYHLVLNPDIWFGEDVLPALVSLMDQRRGVGLCIPKVLYPDGSLQRAFKLLPTPLNLFLRRFPLSGKLKIEGNDIYEMHFADPDAELNVPFLSGCFMFLRMPLVQEVGGFDERYFMYMEDADLSRRIFERSQCLYYPKISIVHEHQKGSYRNRRLLFIHIKSAIKYFNKWGWIFDRQRATFNRDTKLLANPQRVGRR